MSHFTTIHTQIKDIHTLEKACAELGLDLTENTVARGYGENTHSGQYVIRLKGPYDIAVNKERNHYELTTDWWDGNVEKEVGKNYGRLLQMYGVHKATLEARKRGYCVARQNQSNGEIRLTLQGA